MDRAFLRSMLMKSIAGNNLLALYRLRRLGKRAAWDYLKIKYRLCSLDPLQSIPPAGISYPVWMRTRSSDVEVFAQIFIENEYQCLDLLDGDLILDLGAGV